jgi:hypothetical protein
MCDSQTNATLILPLAIGEWNANVLAASAVSSAKTSVMWSDVAVLLRRTLHRQTGLPAGPLYWRGFHQDHEQVAAMCPMLFLGRFSGHHRTLLTRGFELH